MPHQRHDLLAIPRAKLSEKVLADPICNDTRHNRADRHCPPALFVWPGNVVDGINRVDHIAIARNIDPITHVLQMQQDRRQIVEGFLSLGASLL